MATELPPVEHNGQKYVIYWEGTSVSLYKEKGDGWRVWIGDGRLENGIIKDWPWRDHLKDMQGPEVKELAEAFEAAIWKHHDEEQQIKDMLDAMKQKSTTKARKVANGWTKGATTGRAKP